MRRAKKVTDLSHSAPARKTASSASAAVRGAFPAWIVADENGIAFPAKTMVTARVRDALVLRTVSKNKSPSAKDSSHGRGTR